MFLFGGKKNEEKKSKSSSTSAFSITKAATPEHTKNGAQFLVSKRPAQPISQKDLEEYQREEKEGKEAKVVQLVGNALIVISFIVNWFKKKRDARAKRRRRREKKKKNLIRRRLRSNKNCFVSIVTFIISWRL